MPAAVWRQTLLAAVLVASAWLAGCATGPEDVDLGHVHGLAYDGETLFVASHAGLVKGTPEGAAWSWGYAEGTRYDLMGFAKDTVAADTFYAGGHPSTYRPGVPPHIGLARSTDAGDSWTSRSLEGEVDIHALTALEGQEGVLVAWWGSALQISLDAGASWRDGGLPPDQVLALSSSRDALFAATPSGLYRSPDLGGNWTQVGDGVLPDAVASVTSSSDGQTLLVSTLQDRRATAWRSLDAGTSWSRVEEPGLVGARFSIVFALDVQDAAHAFAATFDGAVYESRDEGVSWTQRR